MWPGFVHTRRGAGSSRTRALERSWRPFYFGSCCGWCVCARNGQLDTVQLRRKKQSERNSVCMPLQLRVSFGQSADRCTFPFVLVLDAPYAGGNIHGNPTKSAHNNTTTKNTQDLRRCLVEQVPHPSRFYFPANSHCSILGSARANEVQHRADFTTHKRSPVSPSRPAPHHLVDFVVPRSSSR